VIEAGTIVSATGPVFVATGLLESVAVTVSVDVAAVVGVPLTAQPAAVNPAGSPVIVQVYGAVPPVTPTVLMYRLPTVPFGSVPSVRLTAAGAIVRTTGPVFVTAGL
jgi:hypothetical protein